MSTKIAYILKGFPRLSESFIANEVRLLRHYGLDLALFSIKRGDELADTNGLPPVHYLPAVTSLSATGLVQWLKTNLPAFQHDQRYWLRVAPVRYLTTLGFAIACAIRYRGSARWIKKSFLKEFLFATHIARQVREDKTIGHLHAHFCHDATTVAWMVSKLTNIPFSFTAHAKDIYQTKLNPGNLLEKKLDATSFAVTCTNTNVEYLRGKTRRPEKIYGVYHGLDTSLFAPCANTAEYGTDAIPRLLSVGRMVEKKGFRYLIDACQILKQKGLEFRLLIIGEPGDQMPALKAAIREYGLESAIELAPPLKQAALAEIYRSASLFVLPCVIVGDGDRDGIPNVMAEAMACGTPVVASRISGIPEIVEHLKTGFLVEPNDSEAIAEAIETLLKQPDLRQMLGAKARQQIEKVFDATDTHRRLTQLFQDMIGTQALKCDA